MLVLGYNYLSIRDFGEATLALMFATCEVFYMFLVIAGHPLQCSLQCRTRQIRKWILCNPGLSMVSCYLLNACSMVYLATVAIQPSVGMLSWPSLIHRTV